MKIFFIEVVVILNKIWIFIILCSLIYSFFSGTYTDVINDALSSGGECVSLMLTLLASMSFFTGFLKIAQKSGLVKKIAKLSEPLLRLIFPEIPKGHQAYGDMSMNIAANFLGLGNAATPLGIKAMKSLSSINRKKSVASRAMCLFTVMNTSSIQLIPTTIIALRMNYNSQNPFIITLPVFISGICGLIAGIIAVRAGGKNKYDIY